MEKVLPKEVYLVTRRADTERPLQENIGIPTKRCLLLRYLKINCFVLTESFLAAADGQVFLNKRMKLVYFTKTLWDGVEALCGRCDSHLGHLLMMSLRHWQKILYELYRF
jgi:hypothetical protein